MTVKQSGNEIAVSMQYESDAQGAGSADAAAADLYGTDERPRDALFTLDGQMGQTPDPADPRPQYNFKRFGEWDGARLVLRTIHGLTNLREVWVLDGDTLSMQRSAQTPGGAGSATRALIYTRGN
jgi:hypothetical protein